MTDKVFDDYIIMRDKLIARNLELATELLNQQPFAKYFEVYTNTDKIIISRKYNNDDSNAKPLTIFFGPIASVNALLPNNFFKKEFSYWLTEIPKNNKKWDLEIKLDQD